MKHNMYDVIVVGSGVGGLVCASYLSKGGLRVLVIEKNKEPGGYCTSFNRRGYIIDTTIHSLQNCEEGNILYNAFNELGIIEKLQLIRCNPTDTIITQEHTLNIKNNIQETIDSFCASFPLEKKALEAFFDLLGNKDFVGVYAKYRRLTFRDLLDSFFSDGQIKAIFDTFLGNIGSFSSNTSSLTAIALLRQFILYGGYYPKGGMQKIPDALVETLIENKGEVLLNQKVEEIVVKNNKCIGARLGNGEIINSKIVISNADMTFTLTKLLGLNKNAHNFISQLSKAKPSYSIYIVYLLLNKSLKESVETGPGIWYVPNKLYIDNRENYINDTSRGMFCSISSKLDETLMPENHDIVRIMTTSRYYGSSYWRKYSNIYSEKLIDQAQNLIPNLRNYIICKGRATPGTMHNYTFNRDGAVCGWMNSVEHVNNPITTQLPEILNLFYVGHWATERYGNGGIAMVVSSGRRIAKHILRVYSRLT